LNASFSLQKLVYMFWSSVHNCLSSQIKTSLFYQVEILINSEILWRGVLTTPGIRYSTSNSRFWSTLPSFCQSRSWTGGWTVVVWVSIVCLMKITSGPCTARFIYRPIGQLEWGYVWDFGQLDCIIYCLLRNRTGKCCTYKKVSLTIQWL